MMEKLTPDRIIRQIEDKKSTLKNFGIKRIALFGSYAEGRPGKNSDLDFLVRFTDKRGGYNDYMGLLIFLQDLFGMRIDLVKEELVRGDFRGLISEARKYEAEI